MHVKQQSQTEARVVKTADDDTLPDFTRLNLGTSPFDEADEESLRSPPPGGPSKSKKGYVAYVVFNGRKKGIFQTWDATQAQLRGFPGNCYKGYRTLEDAEKAWVHACLNQTMNTPPPTPAHPTASSSSGTLPLGSLGPEDIWYAVLCGQYPGVYHGKMAAREALGNAGGRMVKAASEEEANRSFVRNWMEGKVIRRILHN